MAINREVLQASLDRLSRLVPGELAMDATLRQVVGATNRLFGLSGAVLMLVDDDQELRAVATSGPTGELLEQGQIEHGEGPCIDAYVHDRFAVSENLATDARYPKVGPWLAERGMQAIAGLPVRLAGAAVGALNVYVDTPYPWGDDELAALADYRGVVEQLLLAGLTAHRNDELARQLQHALDYRVLIERGVGFLMARDRLDATEAFNRLRSAARHQRRKVVDVARDLLSGMPIARLERGTDPMQ